MAWIELSHTVGGLKSEKKDIYTKIRYWGVACSESGLFTGSKHFGTHGTESVVKIQNNVKAFPWMFYDNLKFK